MIIIGKDCEKCRFGIVDETNKARIKVYCSIKEKWYWWGQCIPCDNREKKNETT